MMNETTPSLTLPITAPPMLEAAIGYQGDAHLVAFFFDEGFEAYFAGGCVTSRGEWDAYELFINHPLVASHLRGYNLGFSEAPPIHYLLLDREARTLSVAPVALAQRLLREQWGASAQPDPPLVVTEAEWEQLVADLIAQMTYPLPAQIMEYWQEHRCQVEQLSTWLTENWEGVL